MLIVPGLLLTVIGSALVTVSFLAADWYTLDDVLGYAGPAHIDFSLLGSDLGPVGAEHAYFQWGAWLSLLVAAVFCIFGSVPVPGRDAYAAVGLVVSVLAGLAAPFVAFVSLPTDLQDDWFDLASTGPYLAAGGFALLAAASVVGMAARPRVLATGVA